MAKIHKEEEKKIDSDSNSWWSERGILGLYKYESWIPKMENIC